MRQLFLRPGLWAVALATVLGSLPGCGSADIDTGEPTDDAGDETGDDGSLIDSAPRDTAVDGGTDTSATLDGAGADTTPPTDGTPTDTADGGSDGAVDGGDTAVDAAPDGADAGCSAPVSCYGGAASELTGATTACKSGTSFCVSGSLGPCIGEVRPSTESCNGVDDDCNGSTDDGLGNISCGIGACANTAAACVSGAPGACAPKAAAASETCGDSIDNNCNGLVDEGCGCVYVAPFGSDTTGTGASSAPFRTIAKAITSAGTGSFPKQVCVGGTLTCGAIASSAIFNEAVTMKDGVSVYGGYNPTGTTWPRSTNCTTTITAADANGVTFPATVVATTILDGFSVSAQNNPTNAAITVTGSTGAVISNDIVGGAAGTNSVGILVQDSAFSKATPSIRDNAISGGTGSGSSIGIRSVNSAPVITKNCSAFDAAGRCTSYGCFGATKFIRGRTSGGTSGASTETYAVKLEGSSNAVIDTSALCSSDAPGNVAGLRISGPSTGVLVRQNQIVAPGGSTGNLNGVGIWMDACGGASPWILDNSTISGQSRTVGGRGDGIRAVGDCHPRVDGNQRIVGGEESAANDAIGVYCAKDATSGMSSKCTILGNVQIVGSLAGFPPNSTGVKCDAGACARIEKNGLISGNQGINTFGVVLNGASTFVDRNVISAGCTRAEGIGVLSIDSAGRLQNNVVVGGTSCTTGGGTSAPTSTYAVRVLLASGLNELDLHSNDLFAGGTAGITCTSRAVAFDLATGATAPSGPRGVVRNNFLHAGTCTTTYDLLEAVASADPRVVQNNDFWYASTPTALYRDENTTNLTTAASINLLSDITAALNISSDPLFTAAGNFHILAGSPCRNTGTNVGAPVTDWEGDIRPQEATSDIGADEFKP